MQVSAEGAGGPFQCPRCDFVGTVPVPFKGSAKQMPALVKPLPPSQIQSHVDPFAVQGHVARVDDDVRKALPGTRWDWGMVRLGIDLIYKALLFLVLWIAVLIVVTVVALFVLDLTPQAERARPEMEKPNELVRVYLILIVALPLYIQEIITLIGHCLCLFVPAESGSKGLAIAAAILAILSFGTGLATGVLSSLEGPRPERAFALMSASLGLTQLVLTFGRWLCFLFFLRALAESLRARWLARSIGNLAFLVLVLGFLVALLLGSAVSPTFFKLDAATAKMILFLMIGLGVAYVVCGLIILVWYLRVLRDSRNLIDHELADA